MMFGRVNRLRLFKKRYTLTNKQRGVRGKGASGGGYSKLKNSYGDSACMEGAKGGRVGGAKPAFPCH